MALPKRLQSELEFFLSKAGLSEHTEAIVECVDKATMKHNRRKQRNQERSMANQYEITTNRQQV